jgi:hypothetical protein
MIMAPAVGDTYVANSLVPKNHVFETSRPSESL